MDARSLIWHSALLATSLSLYVVAAELSAFEWFYRFSRRHEDWELDEIFVFGLVALIYLAVLLIRSSFRLRRALASYRAAEADASRLARHDPLTGLMNRRALNETLEQALAEPGASLSMIAIDLDKFKPVNDLHGHAVGDRLLQWFADKLRVFDDTSVVIARTGGDEFFLALADDEDAEVASGVARAILKQVATPAEIDGLKLHVGVSIGIASATGGTSLDDAKRCADHALYQAKRSGRSRISFYDADLDAAANERARLEMELREAVRADQFVPYFQPIMHLEKGRIDGFEVLARWDHPVRGLLKPDDFIPIAEEIGLIGDIGMSVLHKACVAAQRWEPHIGLSFNVSPHQFNDAGLVAGLRQVIEETGIDPSRLELELTENAVITDIPAAREAIVRIKSLGIKLALDDFGVGFSSLSSLRQLPFDRLKIDRSFVTHVEAHPENQKILRGVLSLAGILGIDATAEGIETDLDCAFVRDLGCQKGQGFHFARPVPAETADWLVETDGFDAAGSVAVDPADPAAVDQLLGYKAS